MVKYHLLNANFYKFILRFLKGTIYYQSLLPNRPAVIRFTFVINIIGRNKDIR